MEQYQISLGDGMIQVRHFGATLYAEARLEEERRRLQAELEARLERERQERERRRLEERWQWMKSS